LQRLILGGQGAASVVESLTTEVGPRLAGSPGDKLAVAWALRAMRERGLVNVRAEPVKVPVWERGVETASILGAVPRPLAISALGWSGATPPRGIEAELVRFDSMDALTSADPKIVAGKIVFLDVKMRETAETTGYGAAVAARWRGPMDAAKKGAVAVVIRSISADSSRVPHTGNMRREKDVRSALPAAALSNADADLLERTLTAHGGVRLALRLGPRWLPDAESANVVGEIPGREIPGEIVLLAAHLDSWDLAEGALDDGAGCGIVLEAGRALAALPTRPRRTVRVVLFAAEENSLAGGKQYAKVHAAELGAHVAGLEADFGTGKVVHVKLKGAPEARSRFAPVAQMLGPLGVTAPDEVAWGGADLSPLHALGVPVVDLAQEPVRYFDAHHSANDTFARIDPATLSQATAAFATATWGLAEMSGDLGRIPEADRDR
jgi:Zn-dependent M28 family amino/carboxypeptidase